MSLPEAAVRRHTRRQLIETLAAAAWQYRWRTLVAVILLVAAKLSAVAVPVLLKRIVDTLGAPAGAVHPALPVALLAGYAVVRFSGTLCTELRDLLFARVTHSTLARLMLRAFAHLHGLSANFHVLRHTGAVTRDIDRGVASVGLLLNVALFTVLPTAVEIGAVLWVLVRNYDLLFSALIMATFVIYAVHTIIFTNRRAPHQRARNELESSANSRLVDSLLNYETVKSYTNERFEIERFAGLMERSVELGVRNQRALSLLHLGQGGIIGLGVAAVMLLAGRGVMAGSMSVGDLVLINACMIQLCLPLNSLGYLFREAADAIVNAERLFRLLGEKTEAGIAVTAEAPVAGTAGTDGAAEPAPLTWRGGEVRFEHVSFSYDGVRPVLADVSLVVPPGKTVAVVGSSGSGKSTLARLLMRFYELEGPGAGGRILIDGQDIRGTSHASLRSRIGVVPQDTVLFNDSIAHNIAYGRAGADRAAVVAAARGARVHDFISNLPEGYDTMVGERGLKLSGGEKQRIAIARALLKNAPLMIFDEATSALDTRSERAIQAELTRLAHNRTTLIIAHRLSTVVDADQIVVLDQGRVVERGTHAQLLGRPGLYRQLWSMQQQDLAGVGSSWRESDERRVSLMY